MEIPKDFEEQKKLAQSRGFKLKHKNYDEFWNENPAVFVRERFLRKKNHKPAYVYFYINKLWQIKREVQRIHAMLRGKCNTQDYVVCYKIETDKSLTFDGIHWIFLGRS